MECPKCGKELEYEEIKWPCGTYYCSSCEFEGDGEWFKVGKNDHEEKLYKNITKEVENELPKM